MKNNYDNIAFCYDWLSRLVFGKAQVRAQIVLLPFIVPGNRVLITGGGTGWILDELCKVRPAGLEIVYVEISGKMLQLSKKRNIGLNKVVFIQQPVEDTEMEGVFDAIFTGFFFDNFAVETAGRIFETLHRRLKPGGTWLFVDFKPGQSFWHFWQKALLRGMYIFFRLICKVEARRLADMGPVFNNAGYYKVVSKSFYKHFIHSIVYKKPGQPIIAGVVPA